MGPAPQFATGVHRLALTAFLLNALLALAPGAAAREPMGVARPAVDASADASQATASQAVQQAAHHLPAKPLGGTVEVSLTGESHSHDEADLPPTTGRRALQASTQHHRKLLKGDVTWRGGTVMTGGAYIVNVFVSNAGSNYWKGEGSSNRDMINKFVSGLRTAPVLEYLNDYNVDPSKVVRYSEYFYVQPNAPTDLNDAYAQRAVKWVVDNWFSKQDEDLLPDVIFNVISAPTWTPYNARRPGMEMCGTNNTTCGWHAHFTYGGTELKYSWVPSPSACIPRFAGTQHTCRIGTNNGSWRTPHGVEVDSLINTLYHEILETLTDPLLKGGWYDKDGDEMADKCSWKWGDFQTAKCTNGDSCVFRYNQEFGGYHWLLQGFWDVTSQTCVWS